MQIKKQIRKEFLSDIGDKNMLKVLTGEESSGYKKKRKEIERLRVMHKYAQPKRFNHGRRLQVYIHYFMDVYPQKIPAVDNFTDKKHLLWTTRKFQLQEQHQNIGLDLVRNVQKIKI